MNVVRKILSSTIPENRRRITASYLVSLLKHSENGMTINDLYKAGATDIRMSDIKDLIKRGIVTCDDINIGVGKIKLKSQSENLIEGEGQPGFDVPPLPPEERYMKFGVTFYYKGQKYIRDAYVRPIKNEKLSKIKKRAFCQTAAPILRALKLSPGEIHLYLHLLWNSGDVFVKEKEMPVLGPIKDNPAQLTLSGLPK